MDESCPVLVECIVRVIVMRFCLQGVVVDGWCLAESNRLYFLGGTAHVGLQKVGLWMEVAWREGN